MEASDGKTWKTGSHFGWLAGLATAAGKPDGKQGFAKYRAIYGTLGL
jgi:hypothetical protein